MNTLIEVKAALAEQKATWLASTTLWSDFSDNLEDGSRMHKEAVEFDFLTENDVVDDFEPDFAGDVEEAEALRSECLLNTLREMGL